MGIVDLANIAGIAAVTGATNALSQRESGARMRISNLGGQRALE